MSRRTRGTGSVRELSTGKWLARITKGTLNGKRDVESKVHSTKAEADVWVRDLLARKDQGKLPATTRQTVADWLEQWLQAVTPTVKPSAAESYTATVRQHLVPALGGYRLDRLTLQHVEDYRNAKVGTHSPTTVGYHIAILRMALAAAVRREVLTRNVAALVKKPKRESLEVRPLEPEEVARLLDAAQRWQDLSPHRTSKHVALTVSDDQRAHRKIVEALLRLSLDTGLRQGELLGLRWRYVNLRGQATVTVAKSLHRDGELGDPKNRQSKRTVDLLGELTAEALRDLRERREAQPDDLVFGGLTARSVIRSFHVVQRLAGLVGFRFHDLRHTCASMLLNDPVRWPVPAVSLRLGHANPQTTMEVYAHIVNRRLVNAAEALQGLVRGEPQRVEGLEQALSGTVTVEQPGLTTSA